VDETTPTTPRFTREEQASAVWLSHTVIPVAVVVISLYAYHRIPPAGFLAPEALIWLVFTPLVPWFEWPVASFVRLLGREDQPLETDRLRQRAFPAAFTLAFVLQFVALTFLLADTGGPISSPFASFVLAYTVFSSLLTTKFWSLGVALLVPTVYFAVMVEVYGFGKASERPSLAVYLAVTLLIIWLTVGLSFLSRLSIWRLQTSMDAEADLATLRAAVATQVWSRPSVSIGRLPARAAAAEAALAEYVKEHPSLALRVVPGRGVEWVEQQRIALAQSLVRSFSARDAAELLTTALGLGDVRYVTEQPAETDQVAVGNLGPDPVLPSEILIRAVGVPPSDDLLLNTVRVARREVAGARIAILLCPDSSDWMAQPARRNAQRSLATSVVILDAQELLRLVGETVPRRALMRAVRAQADLSKTNPFVVVGPTPPPMFFGRADEEATVTALLKDNSAALLGGRRTGKTSLLQRVRRTLTDEGWIVQYLDMHAVGDWAGFADLVSLQWQIEVSREFGPALMAATVREIRKLHGSRPLVIMLDEVDQLLEWDQGHTAPMVPEAFFRSCRALSQEREAQFVLAGERVLARRLWSPDSPHWNFCRPVPVRQLSREASDQLLIRPLEHLEVGLRDPETALARAWQRTSGHPYLLQTIGVGLVDLLNDREPENRSWLDADDVARITDGGDFRDTYVGTYRGRSTPLESSICNLAAAGATTIKRLEDQLAARNAPHDIGDIREAVRMLDVFGVLRAVNDEVVFRAEWMPDALRNSSLAGTLDPRLSS
jgi:hypothetical protein